MPPPIKYPKAPTKNTSTPKTPVVARRKAPRSSAIGETPVLQQHLARMFMAAGEALAADSELRAEIKEVRGDVSDIKKELRGLKLDAIAEIYKSNLTVASFADHERRIQDLERKSS